ALADEGAVGSALSRRAICGGSLGTRGGWPARHFAPILGGLCLFERPFSLPSPWRSSRPAAVPPKSSRAHPRVERPARAGRAARQAPPGRAAAEVAARLEPRTP